MNDQISNQIDSAFKLKVNHWRTGKYSVKKELIRVVRKAIKDGQKEANATLKKKLIEIEALSHNESSFIKNVDEELFELGKLNKSKTHAFRLLHDELDLRFLVEQYAVSNLTNTPPENVLDHIKELEKLETSLIHVAEGVCFWALKREYKKFLKLGYEKWYENRHTFKVEIYTGRYSNSQNSNSTQNQLSGVEVSNKRGIDNEELEKPLRFRNRIKVLTRKDLMGMLHGFPWLNDPSSKVIISIVDFLKYDKLIEESISTSEISALFSHLGPSQPIRFLGHPGKLLFLFRSLAENHLLIPDNPLEKEETTTKKLKSLGFWLIPRLVGTFRDVNGNKFTTIALSKAVDNFKKQPEFEEWYKSMNAYIEKLGA